MLAKQPNPGIYPGAGSLAAYVKENICFAVASLHNRKDTSSSQVGWCVPLTPAFRSCSRWISGGLKSAWSTECVSGQTPKLLRETNTKVR